jgi:hypothetical protein
MPIILCIACLGIVLKENNGAKTLCDEIVQCFRIPGFQQIFDKLSDEIPGGQELIKKIVEKSGLDYEKPPEKDSYGIPQTRSIINGSFDLIENYKDQYTPWILE